MPLRRGSLICQEGTGNREENREPGTGHLGKRASRDEKSKATPIRRHVYPFTPGRATSERDRI